MEQLEIEIKFRVKDAATFEAQLESRGFKKKTPRTFERNTLYDTPARELLNSGRLLRLRQYGKRWVVTFKAKPDTDDPSAAHKSRIEIETEVEDGVAAALILERLGYCQCFVYEKWRTEWNDDDGHLTLDETAIGTYAELEGKPEWIDKTAPLLGVEKSDYITLSYGRLFENWRRETNSQASNLTFEEVQAKLPATT
jgi:adenylate cyclase, class 2